MKNLQGRIIKNIWRTLNWAYINCVQGQEYEDYCDCVYYSWASAYVERETFERMMTATMY